MTVQSKIIADSINSTGDRLTTFQLMYPRYIHSEVMTHRVFSRNASSSRAVPIATSITRIEDGPVLPVFAENRPGMQPGEGLDPERQAAAEDLWRRHREMSIGIARELADLGVHKQWANRVLEIHSHIHVIVTASEFENFFKLRCSPLAQSEFRDLAEKMREQYRLNKPARLQMGDWHLPYVEGVRRNFIEDPVGGAMLSAARCARVSYLRHDGQEPVEDEDLKLAHRLFTDQHLSPFEHQALCSPGAPAYLCGNLKRGWQQFRKIMEQKHGL